MLLDEFCEDWDLLDPVLIEEREDAEFYKVNAPENGTACLQIFKRALLPHAAAIGTAYKVYKGKKTPELYAAGPRAILIELCEGQQLKALIREGRAPAAMDASARLVAALNKTVSPPAFTPFYRSLESLFRSLLEESLPEQLTGMDMAAQAYLQSLVEQDKALLHGNLTPDNIVYHDRHGGWMALEPLGLYGDHAFEAGTFFFHFLKTLPEGEMRRAPELLALLLEKTNLPKDRVLSAALLAGALDHLDRRREAGEEIAALPCLGTLKSLS